MNELRVMTDIPDYVEALGAIIRTGTQGCGISLKEHGGALFPEIESSELRSKFNKAMHVAVAHYTDCIAKARIELEHSLLVEVSFRVVLYSLHRHHVSRRAAHERRCLSIERADLHGSAAKDLCWIYCESQFPGDYARYAAALAEMSIEQFRHYERSLRPLLREMGMLL